MTQRVLHYPGPTVDGWHSGCWRCWPFSDGSRRRLADSWNRRYNLMKLPTANCWWASGLGMKLFIWCRFLLCFMCVPIHDKKGIQEKIGHNYKKVWQPKYYSLKARITVYWQLDTWYSVLSNYDNSAAELYCNLVHFQAYSFTRTTSRFSSLTSDPVKAPNRHRSSISRWSRNAAFAPLA